MPDMEQMLMRDKARALLIEANNSGVTDSQISQAINISRANLCIFRNGSGDMLSANIERLYNYLSTRINCGAK